MSTPPAWMSTQDGVIKHFSQLLDSIRRQETGRAQTFDDDFWRYVEFLKKSNVEISDPVMRQLVKKDVPEVAVLILDKLNVIASALNSAAEKKNVIAKSNDDILFWFIMYITALSTYQYPNQKIQKPFLNEASLVFFIENTFRIAVVGDVGSNDIHHRRTLMAIKRLNPTAVIHLGDIYPDGLPERCKAFWDIYDDVFGPNAPYKTPLWAIPGNHEYVCQLRGFQQELLQKKRLGPKGAQGNTFFALRNNFVQIVGIDTSKNASTFDKIPFLVPEDTFDSHLTKLEDEEAKWLKHVLAYDKPTIMLSHHQYFTHTWAAHNPNHNLKDQIGDGINKIKLWLWGHEHQFYAYKSIPGRSIYGGLSKGRCIGHGAMPAFEKDYSVAHQQATTLVDAIFSAVNHAGEGIPVLEPNWRPPKTCIESGQNVCNTGFAMLEMDATGKLVTKYYEVPWNGSEDGFCEEVFYEQILPKPGEFLPSANTK